MLEECFDFFVFMLLDKLYLWSYASFLKDLQKLYTNQWFAVVNFLYFANLMKWRLLEEYTWLEKKDKETAQKYHNALISSDFLLTDWIALQVFEKIRSWRRCQNLNWTDLTPKLLKDLASLQTWWISVYAYQCYDPRIGKDVWYLWLLQEALERLSDKIAVSWVYQSLYRERWSDFDWDSFKTSVTSDVYDVKVFLNCTGTPFQENWLYEHKEYFKEQWFIVINAWWVVDFMTWFEQRAPDWVVKSRVGEALWRLFSNPGKNRWKILSMFWIFRYFLFQISSFFVRK